METTRGERAVAWILKHCVDPETGFVVTLKEWQRDAIRGTFDNPGDGPHLAEMMRQLFTFGPEAVNAAEAERAYNILIAGENQ